MTLTDHDFNKNSLDDEDLELHKPETPLIPSVRIGSPITLAGVVTVMINGSNSTGITSPVPVDGFSDIMRITTTAEKNPAGESTTLIFKAIADGDDLNAFLADDPDAGSRYNSAVFQFLNYDIRSLGEAGKAGFAVGNDTHTMRDSGPTIELDLNDKQGLVRIPHEKVVSFGVNDKVDFYVDINKDSIKPGTYPVAIDLFSFGQIGDGVLPDHRINNAIYRLELEESGDNTGVFEGTMEFVMLNQINVRNVGTYEGIDPISDGIVLIVHNDLTDEDSVRINYFDRGADGVDTQIADQVEAPTTSGIVTFDYNNYKVADTVTVTLQDADMNTDVDTIDVFTVVDFVYPASSDFAGQRDSAYDQVGVAQYGRNSADENFGRILDITIFPNTPNTCLLYTSPSPRD